MREDTDQQVKKGIRKFGFELKENVFIMFQAGTYRSGTTQTAEVTASVRRASEPTRMIGVETFTCQITNPVQGEPAYQRRKTEVSCSASWDIGSDSDDAMLDFTVTARASSEGIGDLLGEATFTVAEASSPCLKSKNI